MRGELGALLRADPLRALVGQPARESQPPRREDQRERDDDDEHGERRRRGRAERAVEPEEDERARRRRAPRPSATMPSDGPREPQLRRGRPRRRRACARSRAGGSTTAAPCDWRQISAPPPRRARAARRSRRRPRHPTRGTAAAGEREQPTSARDLPALALSVRRRRGDRRRPPAPRASAPSSSRGRSRPRRRGGEDEPDAQQQRVDAERRREARAHPGQHRTPAGAAQRRSLRLGHRHCGGCSHSARPDGRARRRAARRHRGQRGRERVRGAEVDHVGWSSRSGAPNRIRIPPGRAAPGSKPGLGVTARPRTPRGSRRRRISPSPPPARASAGSRNRSPTCSAPIPRSTSRRT